MTFVRVIGLLLMVFGGFLIYSATGTPQTVTGSIIMAVSLGIMIPQQIQTAFQIIIGALRSLARIKQGSTAPPTPEAPERKSTSKLGQTVSAEVVADPRIEKEMEL